jgi:hypothetical protein
MRRLVPLVLALSAVAGLAQSQSTSNSTALLANAPSAIDGGQRATQPTINQPKMTGNGNLYDDFDGKWLDPAKWIPTNPQCDGNVLECVREIRNNKLRLVARNFGARTSDSGIQWSESEVYFTKPNQVVMAMARRRE